MSEQNAYIVEVYLGEERVGYLTHYHDGKNHFAFGIRRFNRKEVSTMQ